MDLQLNGKVALVTAASRGLGRAVAMEFAREGVSVAICSHSDLIDKTAEEIRKETGGKVLAVYCDLTNPGDIEKLISSTNKEFGLIDILFLNAGGPKPGAFLELSLQDWEIAVNQTLMSAVRLCYAAVPQMISKGAGSIVATQSHSIGRIGTVEEFGKTVVWLASPAASFIHGHALMFDGGAVKSAL